MKVLYDTNVILDVLLDRPRFAEPAAALLAHAERGEIQGFVCATTVTTIFYLARKALGREQARRQIGDILSILDVAPVNRVVLERAARSKMEDFEDAVITESARQVQARIIVTRDVRDFAKAPIPVHSPSSLLALPGLFSPPSPGAGT